MAIAVKTAWLLAVTAMATQMGGSHIIESVFHRVAIEYRGMFSESGHFSNVPSTLICARVCTGEKTCSGFIWDSTHKICSVGQVGTVIQAQSKPASGQPLFFQRIFNCMPGYELNFAGKTPMCLQFMRMQTYRNGAVEMCESIHGYLARPHTQEMMDVIFKLSMKNKDEMSWDFQFVYVDGTDEAEEGVFTWSNGRPFTHQEMQLFDLPREPSKFSNEDYVMLDLRINKLHDATSSDFYIPCVCQMDV